MAPAHPYSKPGIVSKPPTGEPAGESLVRLLLLGGLFLLDRLLLGGFLPGDRRLRRMNRLCRLLRRSARLRSVPRYEQRAGKRHRGDEGKKQQNQLPSHVHEFKLPMAGSPAQRMKSVYWPEPYVVLSNS